MNAIKNPPKANLRLNRIRFAACFFKWISIVSLGLVICIAAMAILRPEMVSPAGTSGGSGSPRIKIISPILLGQFEPGCKWLYPVFWIGFAWFLCRGICFFYRLFGNMERGIIFGRDNVRCIRLFGWWLVACPLLGAVFEFSKIIWEAGPVLIDVSDLVSDLGPALLRGFFVVFVAWIMDVGRKIQEEQELTV